MAHASSTMFSATTFETTLRTALKSEDYGNHKHLKNIGKCTAITASEASLPTLPRALRRPVVKMWFSYQSLIIKHLDYVSAKHMLVFNIHSFTSGRLWSRNTIPLFPFAMFVVFGQVGLDFFSFGICSLCLILRFLRQIWRMLNNINISSYILCQYWPFWICLCGPYLYEFSPLSSFS